MFIHKHVKTSQQLKLSNFVKRKGDNNDAVTCAIKTSKSSSINDVEMVHASSASKACNCKSETKSGCCNGKKCLDSNFQDSWLSDSAWLVYENDPIPSMTGNIDFLKGCKTFKKETLKIHSENQKHKGIVVKGLMWRMIQQKISKLGFSRGKY